MFEVLNAFLLLLLLAANYHAVRCDVTGTNPPAGSALCIAADSTADVLEIACGNVIGTVNTGECYTYTGTIKPCSVIGETREFFQLMFGGQLGWVDGVNLVVPAVRTGSNRRAAEPKEEFRSLFVATVDNIDWPRSSSDPVDAQRSELLAYLDMMAATNMNAVMFQARTTGDALYNSSIEPWSKYLTGTQGTAPSPYWDPLELLVTEAHSRGIQVHAWLNPYRANMAPNWDGLADNHMAVVYREYAYPYDTYLWMDPGAPVVSDRLVAVVQDIINRYGVDGVHFDDYFYPYPDDVGTPFPDDATYQAYLDDGGTMSRDDWRRDNVNRMIERVYNLVKSAGSQFSLSPFGLYRPGDPAGMPPPITGFDPYTEIYADALLWLQQGWVDFLAPQLYWSINATGQSYPTLLDWWLEKNTAGKYIYAANAVYKIVPPSSWSVAEIEAQVDLSRDSQRRSQGSMGNILFSAKYFRDNTNGIRDAFQQRVYTTSATVPPVRRT